MSDELPAGAKSEAEAAKTFAEYARSRYADALGVYQWHENKAGRYLTVLAFLVGGMNVIIVPQVLWVLEHRAGAITTGLFVAGAITAVGFAIRGCWCASQAMKVARVPGPSTDTEAMIKVFTGQPLERAYEAEGRQILEAVAGLRRINEQRAAWLAKAHWWMLATYLIVGPTLGLLVYFRYQGIG